MFFLKSFETWKEEELLEESKPSKLGEEPSRTIYINAQKRGLNLVRAHLIGSCFIFGLG
jgi:hypothetical protein